VRKRGHPSKKETSTAKPSRQLHDESAVSKVVPADYAIFRTLLDNIETAVAHATPDGELLYANPRFAEMVGKSLRNIVGADLKMLVARDSWQPLTWALTQATMHSVCGTINVIATDQDHSDRVIRLSFSPVKGGDATTIEIVGTEVTEQLQTEKTLQITEESLKSVSSRLLQIQDEERRRLARELHDSVGQELALIIMTLDRVAMKVTDHAAEQSKIITGSTGQLRKMESDIRTLSYVLHPPLLDDMGLAAALKWYVEGFSKRTDIEVSTQIPEHVPRFESEKETALFRVIQESLSNVYRHSGSKRARVQIAVDSHSIEARIEDEGRGLPAGSSDKLNQGVGLQSMRGRLEIVGGKFDIYSDSRGTNVVATVPIQVVEIDAIEPEVKTGAPEAAVPSEIRKRVLIADDHEVARRGIRILFDGQNDLQICGEACDGVEAVKRTKELKPDLVIMDLSMPKMGGLLAAGQIRAAGLESKIIVYTSHSLPQLEKSARLAGCDGYVVKSDATRDLLRATRDVLAGHKFYRSEQPNVKVHSA
jgi:PAS domain S-box-containing protein